MGQGFRGVVRRAEHIELARGGFATKVSKLAVPAYEVGQGRLETGSRVGAR